jgi:hypothetical protein
MEIQFPRVSQVMSHTICDGRISTHAWKTPLPSGGLFAECQSTRHSAKKTPLPSAYESSRHRDWRWGPLDPSLPRASRANTRQRICHRHLAPWRWLFFAECHGHSANSLRSARQKILGKEAVVDVQFAERSLPSITLGKAFAECKIDTRQRSCVR